MALSRSRNVLTFSPPSDTVESPSRRNRHDTQNDLPRPQLQRGRRLFCLEEVMDYVTVTGCFLATVFFGLEGVRSGVDRRGWSSQRLLGS